jgi:hypothetical protein
VSAEYAYDYAILRLVPRVERGECINAGVVLSCPGLEYLEAAVKLDPARLAALDPTVDIDAIRAHLDAVVRICRGGAAAGPLGELPQRGRFHWLVSPRSTVVQMSPVHTGRTANPATTLARLICALVDTPDQS